MRAIALSSRRQLAAIGFALAASVALGDTANAARHLAIVPLVGTDAKTRRLARTLTRKLAKTLRHTRAGRGARVFPRGKATRLLRCVRRRDCLDRLGRSLGLRYFVAGQVARIGRRYHIDVWLLSVERGGVMRSAVARARQTKTLGQRLARAARRLVHRLPPSKTSPVVAQRAPAKARAARRNSTPDEDDDQEPTGIETPAWIGGDTDTGGDSGPLWKDLKFWAWVSAGSAVATLGTALGFGIANLVAKGNATDAVYQGEAAIEHDAARKDALAANILFGIGGAVALGSGLLFYLAYRPTGNEERATTSKPAWQLAATPLSSGPTMTGGTLLLRGQF